MDELRFRIMSGFCVRERNEEIPYGIWLYEFVPLNFESCFS